MRRAEKKLKDVLLQVDDERRNAEQFKDQVCLWAEWWAGRGPYRPCLPRTPNHGHWLHPHRLTRHPPA